MKRVAVAVCSVVVLLGVVIFFTTVEAQGPGQKVPDTVSMHSPAWDASVWTHKVGGKEVQGKGKQYKDFVFTHKKHAEDHKVACTECHHRYEGKKNVWKQGDPVKKCQECHNIVDLAKKKDPMSLYAAYHGNCVECHKELKKEAKAAGKPKPKAPTGCTECHKKKEAH